MGLKPDPLSAQTRYARWLAFGTRAGFALLALSFAAYVLGLPPHIPIEELPELWHLPSADLVARTGLHAGWAFLLPAGDMLVMAAIAVIATCSVPCLLAVAPVFARARERVFLVVCLLEVLVLLVAASGLLIAAH